MIQILASETQILAWKTPLLDSEKQTGPCRGLETLCSAEGPRSEGGPEGGVVVSGKKRGKTGKREEKKGEKKKRKEKKTRKK